MRSMRVALFGAVLLLVAPAPVAADTASPPSEPSSAEDQYCAVLMEPVQAGETASDITWRGCAPSRAALNDEVPALAAASVLLTVCEHANYGPPCTNVLGANDGCLTRSYHYPNLHDHGLGDRISSWDTGHSSCSMVRMWEHVAYGGRMAQWHWFQRVAYVGDAINDRASSMTLAYQP